jgi:hypothetical protein
MTKTGVQKRLVGKKSRVMGTLRMRGKVTHHEDKIARKVRFQGFVDENMLLAFLPKASSQTKLHIYILFCQLLS